MIEATEAVAQLLQAIPEARITVVFRPVEEASEELAEPEGGED